MNNLSNESNYAYSLSKVIGSLKASGATKIRMRDLYSATRDALDITRSHGSDRNFYKALDKMLSNRKVKDVASTTKFRTLELV